MGCFFGGVFIILSRWDECSTESLVKFLLIVICPFLVLVMPRNHIPFAGSTNSFSSSFSAKIWWISDSWEAWHAMTRLLSSIWYVTMVAMVAKFGSTIWNSCDHGIPYDAGMLCRRVRMATFFLFLRRKTVLRSLRPPMLNSPSSPMNFSWLKTIFFRNSGVDATISWMGM